MKIGLIIPTMEEAHGLPEELLPVSAIGFGPGKASTCAAAAHLIFDKDCDAILVWGTAGAMSERIAKNDVVVVERAAYNDYCITPLYGAEDVGDVPYLTTNGWWNLDPILSQRLMTAMQNVPRLGQLTSGAACSADHFRHYAGRHEFNRIEAQSDVADMETMAVCEFVQRMNSQTNRNVRVCCVRVASNSVFGGGDSEWLEFLKGFGQLNASLPQVMKALAEC